ncbi:class I mannose-6-phosphate isomerase [bacterium]|nr:class I mannose-6-phosphate isomerase [bacterium]
MPLFPPTPFVLDPVFSPRPWGGQRLAVELGKALNTSEPIGESWELSDHPHGRSRIATGEFAGELFGDVLRRFPREMIGRTVAPERYPLLVKFIDADSDLSIQVHPDDGFAESRNERGKTECWYVMACAAGAEVIHGLRPGITPEELRAGAKDGRIEQMVARGSLEENDFLFVPPGTVHAILAGTLICEIQQSSDATYRLWDWGREPKRELHVEDALQVIGFNGPAQESRNLDIPGSFSDPITLTDNQFFRVRMVDVPAGQSLPVPPDTLDSGLIVVCVAGKVQLGTADGEIDLARGQTGYVPAICERDLSVKATNGPTRILLAESREL